VIPKHCADRAALLEACIEAQQALASERTGRCSGAQPIPKRPKPHELNNQGQNGDQVAPGGASQG
jgi:hypothetical protein